MPVSGNSYRERYEPRTPQSVRLSRERLDSIRSSLSGKYQIMTLQIRDP
jgi:hypothetical protein